MYSYCWVWWNVQMEVDVDKFFFFPPEILPFHVALVLSALTWLLVLHLSSVSVLMLIMPPIKIYIKSYNATRSHASDQSPGKAETVVKKDIKSLTWFYFTLNNSMISKFTKFLFCVSWDGIKIYSWFSWEKLTQSNKTPGLLDQVLSTWSHSSSDKHLFEDSIFTVCLSVSL